MSGHNKWSQIKRQKGANDSKNSKVWGKFSKRISVESKIANGNVESPTLRSLIKSALATSMSKDAIDRAIAKGISADSVELESVTYETYGPGGVAILIDCLTDSRNRTAQEMKHLLTEMDLALAAPGSASWAFSKNPDGTFTATTMVPINEEDSTKLEKVLETIDDYDDVQEVYTNAE